MTNSIYYSGANLLASDVDFAKASLGVAVIDKSYVFNAQTHTTLTDIESDIIGKASLDCRFLEDNKIYADTTTVLANTNCDNPCANFDQACALLIYKDNCTPSLDVPIALIQDNIFGFPLQFSGPEIEIKWDKKGIMSLVPCSPGLSPVGINGGFELTTAPDFGDAELLNNYFLWFGAHQVYDKPIDVKLITPTIDNNGQVSCVYAKAFLAEVLKAEVALIQKRYVTWDGRAISFSSIGDIQELKRMWEHKVQQACASGCEGSRKPISFSQLR